MSRAECGSYKLPVKRGQVKVNGVKELRRRNKITAGMVVELGTKKVKVARSEE